jgi:hypothetical protein
MKGLPSLENLNGGEMHELRSKEAMIRYVGAFGVPHLLVDQTHPAVYFSQEARSWKWSRQYLMSLTIKQLEQLCDYLEAFFKVRN